MLIPMVGAARFTVTVRLASSLLPAASVIAAVIVCGPLPSAVTSAAGTPTLQLPEASSMVV
ncbi:hypothetical protein OkiPb00186_12330 [Escherichia coli]